jgi:hypothetical protein
MKAVDKVNKICSELHPRIGEFRGPFVFKRLYPGWAQRAEGAWSWVLVDADHRFVAGSQWNVGECWEAFKTNLLSTSWSYSGMGEVCLEVEKSPELVSHVK